MRTRARQGPHGEPDLDHSPQHGLPACPYRRFFWSAQLLGFSLGGFFDGILLHQVLQWHHLLSAVSGSAVQELQVQLLADGLFHLLMYVIAVIALAVLWTTPRQPADAPAGRQSADNPRTPDAAIAPVTAAASHGTRCRNPAPRYALRPRHHASPRFAAPA